MTKLSDFVGLESIFLSSTILSNDFVYQSTNFVYGAMAIVFNER